MIIAKDIMKRYGSLEVLRGISLEVRPQEIMAIVGPSGAGKTTLLQILGTLDAPDSGSVVYDSTDILRLNDSKLSDFRNRNIGFVFQFHQLLPEFSLLENVALPAIIAGAGKRRAKEKAMELIRYLGLAERAAHRPDALSGGEKQRAAVARALVNDPQVVFADEPTGSLDSHNRMELHRLFFDLRRDLKQTFVIVTHDEALAADADRIVRMSDGRVERITENRTL